jgi:hypothetical protein
VELYCSHISMQVLRASFTIIHTQFSSNTARTVSQNVFIVFLIRYPKVKPPELHAKSVYKASKFHAIMISCHQQAKLAKASVQY